MKCVKILMALLLLQSIKGQNILEVFSSLNLKPYELNESDWTIEDTLISEVSISYTVGEDTIISVGEYQSRRQGSIVIVSGFYSDMQCSYRPSYMFHKKKGDTAYQKVDVFQNFRDATNMFDVVDSTETFPIFRRILSELRGQYLDDDADEWSVLHEFYDLRFIPNASRNELILSATICDYIPTNEMELTSLEMTIIENAIRTLRYKFNRRLGKFELI